MPGARHRFALLAAVAGLLVALVATEVLLRAAGYAPWSDLDYGAPTPLMHEPDAELGWRNKPGEYVFGTDPIRMTFRSDHTRATAAKPLDAPATALVLGCSFVQGWAVSDHDTFAWRLQQRFPGLRFLNFGTAGYGTTQSLLALRRYLAEGGPAPKLVIYGFSDFHEGRNVAPASWLKTLSQLADRGHVSVPFATLDRSGALEIHPPESFPSWWLHRRLSTVAFLEERWARLGAFTRTRNSGPITESLLLELDKAVSRRGGKLVVAMLSEFVGGGNARYAELMNSRGIASADCTHPAFWSGAMQVPVYGHPNANMNAHWASCIESALLATVPEIAKPAQAGGAAPSARDANAPPPADIGPIGAR